MNRGLGRIERAILNLIENEGDVHGPEDLAIEIYNSFPPTRADGFGPSRRTCARAEAA